MSEEAPTVEGATFARRLADLKRRGCALLVVGPDASTGHGGACERLLGEPVADVDRRRILVRTDRTVPTGEAGADAVVEYDAATRSGAAFEPVDPDGPPRGVVGGTEPDADPAKPTAPPWSPVDDRAPVPTTDLEDLGAAVLRSIDDLAAETSLDPGQLRVCVDSVVPLLADHPTSAVFRLCHLLGTRVRQHRGIAHVHLPVERADTPASVLSPLFDAVIEVRTDGDDAEHRWILREQALTSDWLAI